MSSPERQDRKYRDKLAQTLRDTPGAERQEVLTNAQSTDEYKRAAETQTENRKEVLAANENELSAERLAEYAALENSIGETPLVELAGRLPNGNRLFVKEEFRNPLGQNHYDRVYTQLFKEKERRGIIMPGMKVFETTSGSAGVSFAAIGTRLGYQCYVAVPEGGEQARIDAIKAAGAADVIFTEKSSYVRGFKRFIPRYLKEHPDAVFLNHSMGDIRGTGAHVNETAVESMYDIADEVAEQIVEQGVSQDDVIVLSALGNGTNTLGISKRIHEIAPNASVIAFEPLSAGTGYALKSGGEQAYWKVLDPSPERGKEIAAGFERHDTPGLGFSGFESATIRQAVGQVDRVVLFASAQAEEEYKKSSGKDALPPGVVKAEWKTDNPQLQEYGRSTLAGIAVADQLAKEQQGKSFVVIAYDTMSRYDKDKEIA